MSVQDTGTKLEQKKKMSEIAEELNKRATGYRIGRFQTLRKESHRLSKVPTSKIFSSQTIFEDYAFHHGGRTELQLNIGFEPSFEPSNNNEVFRYGVAFSLERSQSLPDISILFPKIERFNRYFREHATEFLDMQLWYWDENNVRIEIRSGREIPVEIREPEYFIFFGKRTNCERIDFDDVLQDFDRLLNLYEYVEGEGMAR
jgi:hypothetical protein